MKKRNLILAILCLALGFTLLACSDDDEEKKDTGPVQKEAGVDMKKALDLGPDKKVTKPDKGPDGVTKPDISADGVTKPDISLDSAPPDAPGMPDMPKASCSLPFKFITLSGGKGSASGEIKSTDTTSKINLAKTSCTKDVTLGVEHIYAVYLSASSKYYIAVTPASGYNTALYVFTDCSKVAPTCIAGADANYSGSAESVTFTPPVTGIYYIGVDSSYAPGKSYSYGKYTVAVQEAKAPKNDTCAGASTLSFPTGKMSITETGTTLFATNKVSMTSTGCTKNTSAGADMFYKINMVKGTLYKLKLAGSHNVAMYLFSDCAKIASSCVKGADEWSYTAEEISFTPTATKAYYIAVDGRASTDKGAFTLTVDKFEKPANDTCTKATKLTLAGGKISTTGHTIGATNTVNMATTGCTKNDTEGPDVFYSVALSAGKKYRVTLTPASGYDAAVYMVSKCATATSSCVGGADSSYSGSAEKFDFAPTTSGTYTIGVDTHYASTSSYASGKFTLAVNEIVAPANDTCAKASPLAFTGTKAKVTGDTSFASNSINIPSTGCTSDDTEGPDMFYKVTLAAGKTYKITATPVSGYNLAVYVLSACSKTACVAGADAAYSGSAEKLTYTAKTSGAHYIGIDTSYAASSSYASGKFTLEVEQWSPPKGDSCVNPVKMTFTGTSAKATGDTTKSTNAVSLTSSSCTSYSSPGPDAFFAVTLTAGKSYKVTLTPESTFDSMLYVFTSCNAPETSCVGGDDNIGSGYAEKVTITPKTTGTYFIGVDSYSSSEVGKFTVEVKEFTAPANSICTKATTISMAGGKGSVKGDTSLATNEFGSSINCGGLTSFSGPQLYYKALLIGGTAYMLTLTPGFSAYMYAFAYDCTTIAKINTSCGKTGRMVGSISSGSSGSIVLKPPTNAFIIFAVDSSSSSNAGTFTLDLAKFTPPTNDTCKTAQKVTLVGGKATVTGKKAGATNAMTKCGTTSLDATDLYYKFTPVVGKTYEITFKPKGTGGRFGVWDGSHNCVDSAVATACGVLGYVYVSGGSTDKLSITSKTGDIYFVADGLSSYYDTYDFAFDIVQK